MPKVSEEHKDQRRAQILEGARRCFAQHGYEGATVARLETEVGLSRGAIFNYYPNKAALFVEVAKEMSMRVTDVWLDLGFRALLDAIVNEDPDWLAVQFEVTRRLRTDAEFRQVAHEMEERLDATRAERLERLRGQVRADIPLEAAALYVALIANGLALRLSIGEEAPDLDLLARLVAEGVAPRA